ncbi:MAG: MerR family transcriptional regulator [Firmicutes bacterium]|nr:MerR family transcriptional regulator [Bacillota bacterium]
MKINEVEQAIGMTKKNIRFYEQEGLLTPSRSPNGYRDYSPEDVRVLQQIKLLRRLDIPIEEIKRLQNGSQTFADCLERQLITLKRRRRNLEAAENFCRSLLTEHTEDAALENLPIEELLREMDNIEKGGTKFMNVREKDRRERKRGAFIGAGLFILLMSGCLASTIWGIIATAMPVIPAVILTAIPTVLIVCTLFVLWERFREIEGGEMDEASKY